MKPSYTFIDHTADILFRAEAETLAELFEQCGLALEETQVHLENLEAKKTVSFEKENRSVEMLLFDFLDELLFYKDSEQMVFSSFDVYIHDKEGTYKLKCTARGEKLNVEKHQPKVDVKAITMHLFEVKKIEGGWQAQVLVDI